MLALGIEGSKSAEIEMGEAEVEKVFGQASLSPTVGFGTRLVATLGQLL
jgi:hypothetical protein